MGLREHTGELDPYPREFSGELDPEKPDDPAAIDVALKRIADCTESAGTLAKSNRALMEKTIAILDKDIPTTPRKWLFKVNRVNGLIDTIVATAE